MNNYLLKIKRRYTLPLAHRLIGHRPDDRYIIGYPRSGNTWLRIILTNILVPDANSDPYIIQSTLPGVSFKQINRINQFPSPRLIHSHTIYRRDIPTAVYLIRDGRDVLVSYYHYLITRKGRAKDESFSQFFDLYCQGVYGQQWHENVETWFLTGIEKMKDKILVIHFEDLKKNTEDIVFDVANFLGIPASISDIQDAIEKSKIDRLREIEKSQFGIDIIDPNISFYRSGKSGQWMDMFTPEIEQQFYEFSSYALQLGGYL